MNFPYFPIQLLKPAFVIYTACMRIYIVNFHCKFTLLVWEITLWITQRIYTACMRIYIVIFHRKFTLLVCGITLRKLHCEFTLLVWDFTLRFVCEVPLCGECLYDTCLYDTFICNLHCVCNIHWVFYCHSIRRFRGCRKGVFAAALLGVLQLRLLIFPDAFHSCVEFDCYLHLDGWRWVASVSFMTF